MLEGSPASPRLGLALPGAVTPAGARELARRAERAGFDAIWTLDVRRDPYLLAAAALEATESALVGTNVAVAFARSPTVTATTAWDLQRFGPGPGGRFALGLGSQVGPTLAARFGVEADRPAPRMRDYVNAVRDCFSAFERGYGSHDGPYYSRRRPVFQPGPDRGVPAPPVLVAAVNPIMTGVVGEVGDALMGHPFTTELYVEEVLKPALAAGAERAGRPVPPVFIQLVVAPTRELAAKQMIAYTVPAYRRVLDHAGRGAAADRVMAAGREGRRTEARDVVESEYLDLLAVTTFDGLAGAVERWSRHADRLGVSVPWFGMTDAEQLAACHQLIEAGEPLTK